MRSTILPAVMAAMIALGASKAHATSPFCTTWLEKNLSVTEYGQTLAAEFRKSSLRLLNDPRPEVAQKRNLRILEAMRTLPIPESLGRKTALSESEANAVFTAVLGNPVVRQLGSLKRDIGFYFGWAMTAHLHAIHLKVDKRSIAKVFAIGNFNDHSHYWSYHTALLIRADDQGWWVIDPVFGRLMKLDDWYRRLQGMERPNERNMHLYVTEAKRFLPTSGDPYTIDPNKKFNLKDPLYKSYFTDLLQYFRNEFPKRNIHSPF